MTRLPCLALCALLALPGCAHTWEPLTPEARQAAVQRLLPAIEELPALSKPVVDPRKGLGSPTPIREGDPAPFDGQVLDEADALAVYAMRRDLDRLWQRLLEERAAWERDRELWQLWAQQMAERLVDQGEELARERAEHRAELADAKKRAFLEGVVVGLAVGAGGAAAAAAGAAR